MNGRYMLLSCLHLLRCSFESFSYSYFNMRNGGSSPVLKKPKSKNQKGKTKETVRNERSGDRGEIVQKMTKKGKKVGSVSYVKYGILGFRVGYWFCFYSTFLSHFLKSVRTLGFQFP